MRKTKSVFTENHQLDDFGSLKTKILQEWGRLMKIRI